MAVGVAAAPHCLLICCAAAAAVALHATPGTGGRRPPLLTWLCFSAPWPLQHYLCDGLWKTPQLN